MGFSLGGFVKRLLGGGGAGGGARKAVETEEYDGYKIRPASFEDGGHWITSAVISKATANGVREHQLIRADMFPGQEAADAFAVTRSKRMIDELGDRLFESD